MKRLLGSSVALALVLLTAGLAYAGIGDKLGNTITNAAFGYLDCPKAWGYEASRGGDRGIVGLYVTGPIMCVANVGVRYVGVGVDLLTLPSGDNVVTPDALDAKPPLRLP